ncbi:MAG: cellulose binding domain-containing protein, partial [Isosphaeraceae bacterium]
MTENMGKGGWGFLNRDRDRDQANVVRRRTACVETLEPRVVLSGVTATHAVTQDWGSGFQATVSLRNAGSTAVSNWTLEFDTTAAISSLWDGVISSGTGNHYVVRNAGWNGTIPPGGTVSFGYVAGPGGAPTNYLLNGQPLGGPIGPVLPRLDVEDASALEGNSGRSDLAFRLSLSQASAIPVTVQYATNDGTARSGSDYDAAVGSLTFAPGETSRTVVVKILGDLDVEPDETFGLSLSAPSGATLGGATATGTIRDDDAPAVSSGPATFQVTSDWGSGFTGRVVVTNTSATPRNGWTLSFDFAGQITSIWDAKVVSTSGDHHVVSGAGWNDTIPAGGTVSFGFNGSPGGGAAVPTNFVLGGGAAATNRAPTAVNDAVVVSSGRAADVAVLANDVDPDGDPLTVASLTQPREGTAAVNSNGTIRYTPRVGFTGSDSFHYTVDDGRGGAATATVDVRVTNASGVVWPERVYAPYVDVTLWPTPDLVS